MAFTASNGRTQTSLSDINITPLVDVVLVLLIIFMVTAPVLQSGIVEKGLAGAKDPPVLEAAASESRVLMSFDLDFTDISHYPPGTHAGIVVFRLRDQRWKTLEFPLT